MKRGFTLIEVLIALALLAIVLGIVQGVYSGVTRSSEQVQEATENLRGAALLLQRLSDELGSAVPASLDISSDGDDFSRLEFTTEFPQFVQEKSTTSKKTEGAFARLRYEVTRENDGTHSIVRRSAFEKASGDETELGPPDAILQRVVRFRVQWSMDAEQWKSSYTRPGTEDLGESSGKTDKEAPKIVSLELSWRDGGSDGPERSLGTSVPLYRNLE